MKIADDMREFLNLLDELNELVRIKESVDPRNFELSSLIQHMEDGPNKAVLFEKVKGFDIPVVANLYGSIHRCALALGIEPTEAQIELYRNDPQGSFGGIAGMPGRRMNGFTMDERTRAEVILLKEKLVEGDRRALAKECPTGVVDAGSCQDVVIKDNIDLLKMLPIVWHYQEDASPYITPAGLVQKDPDTGMLNIGVRRHMVCEERYGKNKMGVQMGWLTPGGQIMRKYHERGEPCEVALCIGPDPVSQTLSVYSSPHYWMEPPYSEFDIAGVIRGKPLEMVKCKTVDLEVPAGTEIVIEGICPPPPDNLINEGPMIEFTNYMGTIEKEIPYIEVTAITHRKNPIFHTCMTGNSEEHRVGCIFSFFGYEQMWLTQVQKTFPHVKDIGILGGSHGFHAAVSLEKTYEGEDKHLLLHLMATSYFKYITIVDDDIDSYYTEQVEWAKAVRAGHGPEDFIVMPKMVTWEMDPTIDEHIRVTKLGVLATLPFGEKYKEPGPSLEMMKKTRSLFEKYC